MELNFDEIFDLVETLKDAGRLTTEEWAEFINNIKSIKLFAKRDEEANKFYKKYNIQTRYNILKKEGIVTTIEPLSPKELKKVQAQITKYGYVINYLKSKGTIDSKRLKDYLAFLNDYKVNKSVEKFYSKLVAWYTRNNFPDLENTYKVIKAEEKSRTTTAETKPSNLLTDKGLDIRKIDPDKQDLVNSYIKTLEKITGKKISFQ